LVRFGGLKAQRDDVIQVDPPQAYGIVQYARTLDMLARHQWPRRLLFPHGGNQMSLAIAAGFGLGGAESYPGVFGDFGGFADDAELKGGYLTLSEASLEGRRPGPYILRGPPNGGHLRMTVNVATPTILPICKRRPRQDAARRRRIRARQRRPTATAQTAWQRHQTTRSIAVARRAR
jgi:hypothetical protein